MMRKILSPLVICVLLSACGGGGGTTSDTSPPFTGAPAPAPTLTLASPTIRTIANGSAIPLSAKLSSGGTIRWQVAAGAPGTLSATTGDTVRYLPPANLGTPAAVTVTASGDGASAALTLAVAPDPGAPGVTLLPWRTETDPTMLAPVDAAVDLAGNVYVLLQTNASPTRKGPPSLVKIAPDGAITSLIGTTWFGQPYSATNANRLYTTSGVAVDRAGNLYFGIPGGGSTSPSASILKITPAGVLSTLAGGAVTQTSAIKDGTGDAAQFTYARIVDIDYDDNLYVLDNNNTPRKVTPAGVVTTLSALPAGLNADMLGNTYSYDQATSRLKRTSPEGTASVVPGVLNCVDRPASSTAECLPSESYDVIAAGGATLIIRSGAVRRVVLEH